MSSPPLTTSSSSSSRKKSRLVPLTFVTPVRQPPVAASSTTTPTTPLLTTRPTRMVPNPNLPPVIVPPAPTPTSTSVVSGLREFFSGTGIELTAGIYRRFQPVVNYDNDMDYVLEIILSCMLSLRGELTYEGEALLDALSKVLGEIEPQSLTEHEWSMVKKSYTRLTDALVLDEPDLTRWRKLTIHAPAFTIRKDFVQRYLNKTHQVETAQIENVWGIEFYQWCAHLVGGNDETAPAWFRVMQYLRSVRYQKHSTLNAYCKQKLRDDTYELVWDRELQSKADKLLYRLIQDFTIDEIQDEHLTVTFMKHRKRGTVHLFEALESPSMDDCLFNLTGTFTMLPISRIKGGTNLRRFSVLADYLIKLALVRSQLNRATSTEVVFGLFSGSEPVIILFDLARHQLDGKSILQVAEDLSNEFV